MRLVNDVPRDLGIDERLELLLGLVGAERPPRHVRRSHLFENGLHERGRDEVFRGITNLRFVGPAELSSRLSAQHLREFELICAFGTWGIESSGLRAARNCMPLMSLCGIGLRSIDDHLGVQAAGLVEHLQNLDLVGDGDIKLLHRRHQVSETGVIARPGPCPNLSEVRRCCQRGFVRCTDGRGNGGV